MRRLLLILAGVTVLFSPQTVYAQNVEYVASTLWSDINDLEIAGNYAYCAFFNGLIVLDITDPSVPVLYGQELLPGNGNGIDVDGNYAYFADGVSGLQIVNISNPANPEFVGGCQTPGEALGIFVSGDYAYVADGDSGLQIIDISNPSIPGLVGACETSGCAVSIFVSGDYAYAADGVYDVFENYYGLEIFDVSVPSSPAPAGSYQTEYQANDVWILQNYAFLATGYCPWGCYGDMEVIDISNPYDPALVGISLMDEGVFRFFASDNHLFISHFGLSGGSVLILDMSDPHHPIFIHDYNSEHYYYWPTALSVAGDYAFVAWEDLFLYTWGRQYSETIDISDLYNPIHTGTYPVDHRGLSVFLSDNYAFVADGLAGLQIVDISDPAAPSVAGGFDTGGWAKYVFVSGSYAYVISYHCGSFGCWYWCDIVDISETSDPTRVSSFSFDCTEYDNWFGDLFVSGDYAYIICTSEFILIWDISDPYSPFLVESFGTPDYSYGIFKLDDYLYISNSQSGLIIRNVSDPSNPFFVGSCETPGEARDVFCSGDYAYIADGSAGLQVIDISQPEDPHITGNYPTPDTAHSVFVSRNHAYLAEWRYGLQVVDVSDPSNPIFAGSYDTPGIAWDISVSSDGHAYLADYYSLIVFRFNPQTGIEEVGDLPRQFALNQNYPNPFNASTSISYSLPRAGDVTIDIYDLLGRKVQGLFNSQQAAGQHRVLWAAADLPSGIYFARLRAGSQSDVIRMTLLK